MLNIKLCIEKLTFLYFVPIPFLFVSCKWHLYHTPCCNLLTNQIGVFCSAMASHAKFMISFRKSCKCIDMFLRKFSMHHCDALVHWGADHKWWLTQTLKSNSSTLDLLRNLPIACKIYECSTDSVPNITHIFPPRFHRPDLPTGLQALLPHADQPHVRLGEAEHPGDVRLHGLCVVKGDRKWDWNTVLICCG